MVLSVIDLGFPSFVLKITRSAWEVAFQPAVDSGWGPLLPSLNVIDSVWSRPTEGTNSVSSLKSVFPPCDSILTEMVSPGRTNMELLPRSVRAVPLVLLTVKVFVIFAFVGSIVVLVRVLLCCSEAAAGCSDATARMAAAVVAA